MLGIIVHGPYEPEHVAFRFKKKLSVLELIRGVVTVPIKEILYLPAYSFELVYQATALVSESRLKNDELLTFAGFITLNENTMSLG